MAESPANDNNTCVVCFKNVVYYSIGECDHPVCFECSTRMRVLCLQNECPICRQDLSRVVFTESIQTYKELRNKVFSYRMYERQYKIGFSTEDIKKSYETLLEYRCKECEKLPAFRTFAMLSDHMRKVHERYFCDLCVKHLRIFCCERKCYTRQELAHHRRKGDLDDTSHRGHPLCEFCEERFMDADELYRHLRKEHLYCHLCDADGRNLYYASHTALAQHFRTDHYLCEEGECAENYLTAVFRTDIDFKAHKATIHGRGLARGAARQARTLELQFNITPHPVANRPRDRDRDRDRERSRSPPEPVQAPVVRIDTRSDEHFPRLSAASGQGGMQLGAGGAVGTGGKSFKDAGGHGLARTDKNFPSLGGGSGPSRAPRPTPSHQSAASAVLRNAKPSVSIQLHSQPTSASNFRLTQASGNRISIPAQQRRQLSDDDFPNLAPGMARDDHPSIGASSVQPSKVTMINSQEMQAMKNNQNDGQPAKKPPLSSEAFPALSAGSAPSAPPQWITVSKSKKLIPPPKQDSPPKPKQANFNQVADFPTLPANKTKKKQQSQPQPQPQSPPPPQPQPDNKLSKKERKKQNAKKEQDLSYVNGITDKFSKQQISEAYTAAVNGALTDRVQPDSKIKTLEVNTEKKNGGNGDFNLASQDYPPLSGGGGGGGKRNAAVAPPGFLQRPSSQLTFTNSSGQSFSAPVHRYIPPPDFEPRNRALVGKFAKILGGTQAVDQFKVASRAFRDNAITAEEFYQHCQSTLGSELVSLFPELVALLPDIGKQQELVAGRAAVGLSLCAACGQLLAPRDAEPHASAH